MTHPFKEKLINYLKMQQTTPIDRKSLIEELLSISDNVPIIDSPRHIEVEAQGSPSVSARPVGVVYEGRVGLENGWKTEYGPRLPPEMYEDLPSRLDLSRFPAGAVMAYRKGVERFMKSPVYNDPDVHPSMKNKVMCDAGELALEKYMNGGYSRRYH